MHIHVPIQYTATHLWLQATQAHTLICTHIHPQTPIHIRTYIPQNHTLTCTYTPALMVSYTLAIEVMHSSSISVALARLFSLKSYSFTQHSRNTHVLIQMTHVISCFTLSLTSSLSALHSYIIILMCQGSASTLM